MSTSGGYAAPVSQSEPFQSAQQVQHPSYSESDLSSTDDVQPLEAVDELSQDSKTGAASEEIPKGQVPEHSDDHSSDHSDDYLEPTNWQPGRPNKFRGAPSTWRNWTAPEREIAWSLDQERSKDLSVHLYNAFKLRQDSDARPHHGRRRSKNREGISRGRSSWAPPNAWSAWPLPFKIVPREEDGRHWEEEAIASGPYLCRPPRPGQPLRDLLEAQILQKAKERFEARHEEGAYPTPSDDEEEGQKERHPSHVIGSHTADNFTIYKPVVIADDEKAAIILEPTTQHIMRKLDALLMGLHHARSSYLSAGQSDSDSQSQCSGRSTSNRRARKRRRTEPASGIGTAATLGDSSQSDTDSSISTKTRSATSGKGKRGKRSSSRGSEAFKRRRTRLGLRDWSDVLGVASIIGFEPAVIENAAIRCAELFNEGVTFRTHREGFNRYGEKRYAPSRATKLDSGQAEEPNYDEHYEASREDEMFRGVHVDGYLKPIKPKKSWKYPFQQKKQKDISRKSKNEKG